LVSSLQESGYAVPNHRLPPDIIHQLLAAAEPLLLEREHANRGGVRDLFRVLPLATELVEHDVVRRLVEPLLGPRAFAVRGILFDKTAGRNWKVAWHQDVTIAVRERRDVPGFGPWSVKAGVVHVQPPVEVLENLLTVRVHLDDCGPDNGPLRVLPGSHRQGILGPAAIERWRLNEKDVACHVPRGGVLLMRPLLLHASAAATAPGHRRVVHLEFASTDLTGGLEWQERIAVRAS
jgi:ectoine hydroxylase-related dioxygenase (phytanoyl-CoA dioxygenase family)